MMKKLILCFPTIGLAAAFAASSYNVTLFDQSIAAGKVLQPGNYKLQLTDDGVVLKHDKELTTLPGSLKTGPSKFNATTVKYGENHQVQEIHLGGTNKIVVVGPGSGSAKPVAVQP
jgi:hypothetical protein